MNDLERAVSPAEYGAVAWGALHSLSAPLTYHPRAWRAVIAYLLKTLDPEQSPATGCGECFEAFSNYIAKNPLEKVRTMRKAQKWTYNAHASVRRAQNKEVPSFKDAAKQWGW